MKRLSLVPVVIGLVAALYAVPALAISIDVMPSLTTAVPGGSFSIDVVVSDLGLEVISSFDLDLAYDASVVNATGVSFGAFLGAPFSLTSAVLSPGLVDFSELSLESDAMLLALQSGNDPFSVANISFDALAVGKSPLTLSRNVIVTGLRALPLEVKVGDGAVGVVPEPAALATFFLGALIVGGAIRRRPR